MRAKTETINAGQQIALSEREAARLMNISPKTLARARDAGLIRYFRASASNAGKVLYSTAALNEFINSREQASV